jgi:hypothetical protein
MIGAKKAFLVSRKQNVAALAREFFAPEQRVFGELCGDCGTDER